MCISILSLSIVLLSCLDLPSEYAVFFLAGHSSEQRDASLREPEGAERAVVSKSKQKNVIT